MKILVTFLFIIMSAQIFSQDAVIAVGQAEQDKDKLVIDDPEMGTLAGNNKALATEFTEILKNDFVFYKHKFNTVDYADKGKNSYSLPQVEAWHEKGVSYFVASQASSAGAGIEVKYRVWSILTKKEIFSSSFKVASSNIRPVAHKAADAIYHAITGKPSIFNSKIVFVSDRSTVGRNRQKELYIMDFDGSRVERLTNFNSVIISPSVAPDNSKIMFSLIATRTQLSKEKARRVKNIDLKVMDLRTKKVTSVSEKPGINSGAIFSSNPDVIYLTLSFSGNADIYEMNTNTGAMRQVTSHYSDDVDPSITADGKMMTFLTNRSGHAHIYTSDPTQAEKDVKRISYVGQFNATPRFSPDGKEIVFTSWVDKGFDLYRIGSDGNNLVRLTKDFGFNEEPTYSPDGEFIVFTSKRVISKSKAVQDLYIMNREGEILGQLTQNFGQCNSPKWTNLP